MASSNGKVRPLRRFCHGWQWDVHGEKMCHVSILNPFWFRNLVISLSCTSSLGSKEMQRTWKCRYKVMSMCGVLVAVFISSQYQELPFSVFMFFFSLVLVIHPYWMIFLDVLEEVFPYSSSSMVFVWTPLAQVDETFVMSSEMMQRPLAWKPQKLRNRRAFPWVPQPFHR